MKIEVSRSLSVTLSHINTLAVLLMALAAIRVLTLGLYPLFDHTESRYAEIARLMAETQNWIVPQYDYGVPFWAKPPLSTWLSAASISLFGSNEFAARFPNFILAIAVAGLTFITRKGDRRLALSSVVILSSSALFFIAAGATMTDMSLAFCTTLSMVAFYRAVEEQQRLFGYLLFCALGLGMLAKGPIAIVLFGLPTAVWIWWPRRWHEVWQRLPWIGGIVLAAVISIPWYVAAEIRSPGFLNYFIFVEHLDRFKTAGEIDDRYGHQNIHPYGTIWLFFLVALLPWSVVLLIGTVQRLRKRESSVLRLIRDNQLRYLLCWTLAPAIFFTFTRNVLWTYVLPALPACSIIIAEIFRNELIGTNRSLKSFSAIALIVPAVMIGFITLISIGKIAPPSGKLLHDQVSRLDGWRPGALAYVVDRPYSGQFYELGRAPKIPLADVPIVINNDVTKFIVIPRDINLPQELGVQLELVGGDKSYQLFRIISKTK
jgi:4-amino-4-deoxy-L-arabinose transferase-like glycosyltransferase